MWRPGQRGWNLARKLSVLSAQVLTFITRMRKNNRASLMAKFIFLLSSSYVKESFAFPRAIQPGCASSQVFYHTKDDEDTMAEILSDDISNT